MMPIALQPMKFRFRKTKSGLSLSYIKFLVIYNYK